MTIKQTNDEKLIDRVYDIVHREMEAEEFMMEDVPAELQRKLNKAIADYKTGNYISHDEMKQKLHAWRLK